MKAHKMNIVFFMLTTLCSLQAKAQSTPIDTNFCKYYSEFLAFHQDGFNKNMDGEDREEMGLDTLRRDGEDELDYTIRTTSANINRMLYKDKIAYKVIYTLYNKENSHIITDKAKNVTYYKETIPFDAFSTEIGAMRDQLVAQLQACSAYESYPIVKEDFDFKSDVDSAWLWMYDNTTIDVFKLKYYQSNLRIVVHVDHSAGMGHFYIYIIDKDHLLDIR